MCCSGNYIVSDRTIENTAHLVAELCKIVGITANDVDTYVIRHYDVTHKRCPAQWASNYSEGFENFKVLVKRILNGDDELMSREYDELKAEINAIKESQKVYHYWSEIPDWALPTVQKLYDRGVFKGDSDADLNLPEVLMRTMVINDRAGLYD